MSQPSPINVLIASYLEPPHVARIAALDARLRVLYEPSLLRPPRYPADHHGAPRPRSAAQEAQWRALLAQADVLFDFDQSNVAELPTLAPRLRWIQATSAGIGHFVRQQGYAERMPGVRFTTASGIHVQPLAEFCLMAMLAFTKRLFWLRAEQAERRWERHATGELTGQTVAIVGMGQIGQEVARRARCFGMHTIGNKRRPAGIRADALHLDALYGPDGLDEMLRQAKFLVLAAPHTDETEAMIGAAALARLPHGAILINIGRGALVDEGALVAALHSGQLGGAALDVFATEPLPESSPLWALPNVLISPHSASTSTRENARLTELFCDNLRRFLDGQPLRNLLDVERLY